MSAFETQVTGSLFLAAAVMLWGGWVLLPVKIDAYFVPDDFAAVGRRRRTWIWIYRLHLFGYIMGVMAFISLATLLEGAGGRIVVFPAVGVVSAGLLMGALSSAFYYHFGAWGSLDMEGKSDETIRGFVDSLRVSTEYVTCLVRFGRVFLGVGQMVLMIGLSLSGDVWPTWLIVAGGVLGVVGMALTMGLPDDLNLYRPVFHANAWWLAAMGAVTLAQTG